MQWTFWIVFYTSLFYWLVHFMFVICLLLRVIGDDWEGVCCKTTILWEVWNFVKDARDFVIYMYFVGLDGWKGIDQGFRRIFRWKLSFSSWVDDVWVIVLCIVYESTSYLTKLSFHPWINGKIFQLNSNRIFILIRMYHTISYKRFIDHAFRRIYFILLYSLDGNSKKHVIPN